MSSGFGDSEAPPRQQLAATEDSIPAILRRPRGGLMLEGARAGLEPELWEVARLCTRLGRATERAEVELLVAEAAVLFDAIAVVVWCSNARGTILAPTLVHGFDVSGRARLTAVPVSADNAVATTFRRAELCVVAGDGMTGAVIVPLLGPERCVGVLALEVPHGVERRTSVRAFATIMAAQLVSAPLALVA